jgi:methionyl-tRNA synthetase
VLRKSDPARMATVLYAAAETIRRLAILSQPVMPDAMGRMLDQLGVAPETRDFAALDTPLAAGTPLPKPEGVFPRYVEPESTEEAAS